MGIADPEAYAANEAERMTEEVAQPIRQSQRSLLELQANTSWTKAFWAFSSEPRQKLAMLLYAGANATKSPAQLAKTALLVFGINGAMVHLMKTGLGVVKGDKEEEDIWDWKNLLMSSITAPLTGFPGMSSLMDTGSLLSAPGRASGAKGRTFDALTGEEDWGDPTEVMRDFELMLTAAALVSDTAATMAAWSHFVVDSAKIIDTTGE
jgi:hypothetical protein